MKHSSIEIGTMIETDAPEFRTMESMLADMQNSRAPTPDEFAQRKSRPFMPTIPAELYADLKAKLHAEGITTEKPVQAQAEVQALAPVILVGPNLAAATNVDGLTPPDTHGAVGLDHFV